MAKIQNLLIKLSLILCSLRQSYQDMTLFTQYSPIPSSFSFYSTQVFPNNFVTISGLANNNIMLQYYIPIILTPMSLTINGLILDPSAKIRTALFNTYTNYSWFGLAYFNNSSLRFFSNLSSLNTQIYNTLSPTLLIRQVCFGVNKNIIYLLVQDTVNNAYAIYFVDGAFKINETILSLTPTGNVVNSFRFYDNRLVLALSSRLVVYSIVGFVLGPILVDLTYSSTQSSYIDVKVQGEFLIYSIGAKLHIYNLTANSYIRNYTCLNLIQSISKISSYILIVSSVAIYQYDYEVGQVIYTFVITPILTTLVRGEAFQGNRLIVYEDEGNMGSRIQMFNIAFQYQTANNSCFYSYNLTGTTCIKDPNCPPLTWPSMALNETTNTTTTIATATNPNPNPTSELRPQEERSYNQFANKSFSFLTTQSASYVFSLSSIKTMPKFLLVFTLLINDLTFYKYHQKFQPQYPNSTLIFMEKFDMLKEVGANSVDRYTAFLDNSRQTFSQNNEQALKSLQFSEHDPQEVYFLYSASGLQSGIIMSVVSYAAIKLVHLLLYFVKDKHQILRRCYKFFKYESRWWVLIVSIVQSNINDLAFNSSLQLLAPRSNTFLDKVNIIFMCLIFFVVVSYSLGFYCLIYTKQRKKCSKNLIVYLKPKRMPSYFFEPALVLVRSVIKSFVNGYLIKFYSAQIIGLFAIDVLFLIVCLSTCKRFKNKSVAFLVSLYFLGFTLFDLFFVLEYHTNITGSWDRQLIGFILCCSLAGICLLLSFVFLILSLSDTYKSIKKILTKPDNDSSKKQEQIDKINADKTRSFLRANKIQNNPSLYKTNISIQNNKTTSMKLKISNRENKSQQKIDKKQKKVKLKQPGQGKLYKLYVVRKNQSKNSQIVPEPEKIQSKKNFNHGKSCKNLRT